MQGPLVRLMSRAKRDFADCLHFIEQQPWGDADARKRDIREAMERIRDGVRSPPPPPSAYGAEHVGKTAARHVPAGTSSRDARIDSAAAQAGS